ncbi:MAG: type II toxin-antitoxin system HicB family antitoxin [Terriglobia bacterium]
MELTAVFKKVPEGYIGFVEELPGANAQEETLDEAKQSLREAVRHGKFVLIPAAVRRLTLTGLGVSYRLDAS